MSVAITKAITNALPFVTDHWPQPEDARRIDPFDTEMLGLLMQQILCPHHNTSKHRGYYGAAIGIEYCNTCGAAHTYLTARAY